MSNEDERREVAKRIRQLADAHAAVEASCIAHALGLEYRVYGTVVAFDSADVHRLADLIDLPKAKREDADNYWLCGHCGAFSRKDAVTDCFSVIPSRCCGNCGREWER